MGRRTILTVMSAMVDVPVAVLPRQALAGQLVVADHLVEALPALGAVEAPVGFAVWVEVLPEGDEERPAGALCLAVEGQDEPVGSAASAEDDRAGRTPDLFLYIPDLPVYSNRDPPHLGVAA